jgi:hypothetical protein
VKRKVLNFVVILAVICVGTQAQGQTQTRNRTTPRTGSSLLESLPTSDAVAQIRMQRLLNEAMPRILANNPTKLAEANANIERFKTRTGLDPRMFEQIAIGVRFTYPTEGVTKLQTAALARGSFSAGALVAAGQIAANGSYREEKYQGKTIYVFNLNEAIRVFGLFDISIRELAVAPLDKNTLALGDPTNVRSAIDAYTGRAGANKELIALASRDPNAIIGFGCNLSKQLVDNLDIGNAPIKDDLSQLRQAYGSVNTDEKDVEIFIAARATTTEAAKSLGDTLELLKQLGGAFVGRLSGAKGVLAKSALSNLKIATQANELQLRTAVAQADLGPVMGN